MGPNKPRPSFLQAATKFLKTVLKVLRVIVLILTILSLIATAFMKAQAAWHDLHQDAITTGSKEPVQHATTDHSLAPRISHR